MQTYFDTTVVLGAYNTALAAELEPFLAGVKPFDERRRLLAGTDVPFFEGNDRLYYVVRNGCLHFVTAHGPVLTYEEKDFVGIHNPRGTGLNVQTPDFAVDVDVYRERDIVGALLESPELLGCWQRYASIMTSLLIEVLGSQVHTWSVPKPALRAFSPGAVIIQQGDKAESVFTLVEGEADVLVDNTPVGQVRSNELFGAIAAITGSPRTASVVARTECIVMHVDHSEFSTMLRTHPSLVTKLMEDMARTIQDLNANVVGLTKGHR